MILLFIYYFPPFLSGRYLRDDTMDLLEIFRVDVLVYVIIRFFKVRLKIHFRSRDMADFRFFMSTLFLRNYKNHQIFRDDRSYLVDVHNGVERVGRHFRSSLAGSEIKKLKISEFSFELSPIPLYKAR